MSSKEPTVLKVRKYEVKTAEHGPVKVFLTGDWHVSPIVSERQYEFLKEALEMAKPDVIILQGDLVDSPVELSRETSLLKLMKEMKLCASFAPTVMVLGSHDFITPTKPAKIMRETALPKWRVLTEKCGVRLLMDEWYENSKIRIFGAFQDEKCCQTTDKNGDFYHKDQPEVFEKHLQKLEEQGHFRHMSKQLSKTTWFCSHAPMLTEKSLEILADFEVLSFGHTHGGIIPRGMDEIMEKTGLHFGLYGAGKDFFPRKVRGAMDLKTGNTMVVNPGMVGAQFCAPRVFQSLNFIKAAEVSLVEVRAGAGKTK